MKEKINMKGNVPTPGILVSSRIEVGLVDQMFNITDSFKKSLVVVVVILVSFGALRLLSRVISSYTCCSEESEATAAF